MSAEAPTAEGVLEYLVKTIVEQPDEVRIETSGDKRCTFSVTVAAVSYTHLTLPTIYSV